MIYKRKQYNLVNEKTVDNNTYQCFRSSTNPLDCIIVKNETEIKETNNLSGDWEKVEELWH